MRTSQLTKLIEDNKWEDAWWLCCEKEIHPDVLNTSQIEDYLSHNGTHNIAVLHVNEAGNDQENWIFLTCGPTKRATSTTDTATISGDNSGMAQELADTRALVLALTERLNRIESHVLLLDKPVREALEIIEERARFLNESEEALIAKMDEQERTQAELDQLREELASRQAFKVISAS